MKVIDLDLKFKSFVHHFDLRKCIQLCSCILIRAGQEVLQVLNVLLLVFFHPLAFQTEGLLLLPVPICLSVRKLYLVRTITCHRLEFESPNLHQTCIMRYFQLVLKIGLLTLNRKGILALLTQNVGNLACPSGNSSQIWAWITQFAPNMHPGILLAGIENGVHWP